MLPLDVFRPERFDVVVLIPLVPLFPSSQKRYRDTARERTVFSASIDQDGIEIMPCSRCWRAKPQGRCIMKEGSNRCSNCVRLGKSCDGPNVADSLIKNLSEQKKIDEEIAAKENLLAETLNSLTRLRKQRESMRDWGAELFRRGMESLDEVDALAPPSPGPADPSGEQSLVGQAQSLGALGVIDWEAVGISNPDVAFEPPAGLDWLGDPVPAVGQDSSGGIPPTSQGS
ncbi:hypothetical protein QBC36DRAFT_305832 [Triangularia setosa]|uniref:Uncharacterized protein n=1 Tax=Triangularia setosa TaxID=2587417 RepID=A0AAN7A332_9PEZI|nr:hypothetical protein QBC36DRAFT_305832 [Podospora setosa]